MIEILRTSHSGQFSLGPLGYSKELTKEGRAIYSDLTVGSAL